MQDFIGIVNFNQNIASSSISRIQRLIEQEVDSIEHQHCLLGYYNVPNGTKPFRVNFADQMFEIVLSGKLFNAKEISHLLKHKGYEFDETKHDQVILYAFIEWKENCVQYFNGNFSFIISNDDYAFIARDQLGIKPLFYAQKGDGEWLISTEMKTILKEGSIRPVVTKQGLLELLSLGPSITDGSTLYKNIYGLEAGNYLKIVKNKGTFHQYHQFISKPHYHDVEETIFTIRHLVDDSIKRQTDDVDEYATFISGGIDSAVVTQSSYYKGMKTYSLDYEDNETYFKGYSYQTTRDQEYIEAFLNQYPTDQTYLTMPQQDLVDLLDDAVVGRDAPGMGDIDSSLLWLLKQAKEQSDVVLTGECGDELFGGYPWYYREDLIQLKSFPWLQSLDYRLDIVNPILDKEEYKQFLDESYHATLSKVNHMDGESEEDARTKDMMILCLKWFMLTLVTRQDGMSRLANMDARVPLADIRIADYLFNTPWDMKYLNQQEKGLLREAFKDVLPDKITNRKKNPFPKTYNPKYTRLVKEKLANAITDENSILHFLFKKEALEELLETEGKSFEKPWFGQLMMGPQLLAYLYQIHAWGKIYHIEFEI